MYSYQTDNGVSFLQPYGAASATLTSNSLSLSGGSAYSELENKLVAFGAGGGSIAGDDVYSLPVDGSVMVLFSFSCTSDANSNGSYSIGEPNVLRGGCSNGSTYGLPAGTLQVPMTAVNHLLEVKTSITGYTIPPLHSQSTSLNISLALTGFQDANGNAVIGTLVPEPGTLGFLGLALAGLVLLRRSR